ncbi:MAG: hypothetical protein GC185_13045 [Alphaproteobacteria bacterium]|nr:hypothetical protein [Alphaproteobacteria bacterium]
MQDEEKIISLLRDERAPALGEDATRRIAHAATQEFIRTRPAAGGGFRQALAGMLRPANNDSGGGGLRAPVMAALLLAIFVGSLAVLSHYREMTGDRPQLAQDDAARQKTILAQFNAEFSGRVQAVISTDGHMQIVLGKRQTAEAQPIAISLAAGKRKVEILSFSGENVKVSLGGKELSFEALSDGGKGVILTGGKLFWTNRANSPQSVEGLKIRAKVLEM